MFNEKVQMNLSTAKMKIMVNSIIGKGVLCRMHMHPELELLYIKKGKVLYHTENSSVQVNSGEIVFSNSYTPHYTESATENTEYVCIFFTKPDNAIGSTKYFSDFLHKNTCLYHIFKNSDDDTRALIDILESMLYEYKNHLTARDYAILAKKYEIVTLLYRNNYLEEDSYVINDNIKPIMSVLNYIEENYQTPIKLQDIAQKVNLHKNYVCKLFKKFTEKTVTDYIMYVRICEAKKLLNSELQLSEIAYKVGFSSQSYFNKVFKKYSNYTPLEYKKMNEN